MESKIVDSKVYSLKELFSSKFDVDFYQREYVWNRKQIEDLILDLSTEFMKNWRSGDPLSKVSGYDRHSWRFLSYGHIIKFIYCIMVYPIHE